MPDPPQHVAGRDPLAGLDGDGAGREVGEPGVDAAGAGKDHVVAQQARDVLRRRTKTSGVARGKEELAHGMDPLPLGYAIDGGDHLPVERGMDRLAPAVGLAGRDAEQERPQRRPPGGTGRRVAGRTG